MPTEPRTSRARFRAAYTRHRQREGRGQGGVEELLALPYLRSGRWAGQWRVRARTFERFVSAVLVGYVVTNYGTLFRLRLLAVVPFWLLPLVLAPSSDERRPAVAQG